MTDRQIGYRLFMPTNKKFFSTMLRQQIILWRLNKTPIWNIPLRNWLFKKLVAEIDGPPFCVNPPSYFQEGNNTHIGKNFYCGTNFTCLDHGGVFIGDNVMISPNVTIASSKHSKVVEQRSVKVFKNSFHPQKLGEIEIIAPVKIGNNVWIASGCIIFPGVSIGNNAVIGAGSVVTKDIPEDVIAYGNPCKVIRKINENDRVPDKQCERLYKGKMYS